MVIKGLYEAHLPVKKIEESIVFYKSLGLKLAWHDDTSAFFWIIEKQSWLGLWQGKEYKTPYHPSLKHVAFTISYEDMRNSTEWLEGREIRLVPFGSRTSVAPFVRPYQRNASVYFEDPDGNSLEFMCYVDVPEHLRGVDEKIILTRMGESIKQ